MTPLFRPTTLSAPARLRRWHTGVCAALLLGLSVAASAQAPSTRQTPRTADYILAVVNQELVTAGEVEQLIQRIRRRHQAR